MQYSIAELKSKLCIHNTRFEYPWALSKEIARRNGNFVQRMNERGQSHEHWSQERGAYNPRENNSMSKGAEWIGHLFLMKDYGFPIKCYPDLKVYRAPRGNGRPNKAEPKSYNADLPYSRFDPNYPDFQIKSCDLNTRKIMQKGGYRLNPLDKLRPDELYSWMWNVQNKSGCGGRDKVLDRLDSPELYAFVFMENWDITVGPLSGIVVATSPWNLVSRHLEPPVLYKYREPRELKTCLYFSKIEELARQRVLTTA